MVNIEYRRDDENGLLIPILNENDLEINTYGYKRLAFLKENNPGQVFQMQLNGTLDQHLVDISNAAYEMEEDIIKKNIKEEELPPQGTLEWIQYMNTLQLIAKEIIDKELIYV